MHPLTWHTKRHSLIRRVLYDTHFTITVSIGIGIIVPITCIAKIRSITEANRRSKDVTYHLNFITKHLPWLEETIKFGIGLKAHVIVVHAIKTTDRISTDITYHIGIILLHDLTCIPPFRIIKRWNYIQELKESKRCAYRNTMLHPVIPLTQSLLHDKVILCVNGIGQTSGILERNLLVPTFFTYHFLPLERIDTVQRQVQVRQGHTDGRVSCILGNIECS